MSANKKNTLTAINEFAIEHALRAAQFDIMYDVISNDDVPEPDTVDFADFEDIGIDIEWTIPGSQNFVYITIGKGCFEFTGVWLDGPQHNGETEQRIDLTLKTRREIADLVSDTLTLMGAI